MFSRGVEGYHTAKAQEEEAHQQPTATMLRCSGGYATRADRVSPRVGADKSSDSNDKTIR